MPDKKGFIAKVDPAMARPSVDLVAHSMIVRWSYPAFIWMLEPEELFDVVMGRVMTILTIVVLAGFGVGLRWGTPRSPNSGLDIRSTCKRGGPLAPSNCQRTS